VHIIIVLSNEYILGIMNKTIKLKNNNHWNVNIYLSRRGRKCVISKYYTEYYSLKPGPEYDNILIEIWMAW